MSTTVRNWTAGLYAGFYWIGVIMTVVCVALALAGNTDLIYRFEHSRFPLSWIAAGVAMLAFLAAEFCPTPDAQKEASSELVSEWEAVEA